MQDREGVMMWRAENIQACLRIFRRTQHQWLVRDILHPSQGVYSVFVLWPAFKGLIRSIRLIHGKTEIQRTGASHQAWVIVVAPWEPFCTANGSNFALWHSVCQGQTRRVGRFSQASLLAWMNITAWLQGRKPRESNKLFDLFPLQANPLNPSCPW